MARSLSPARVCINVSWSPMSFPEFKDIKDKVRAGEPLDFDDGMALFQHPNLLDLGTACQRGARASARPADLLQPQHAHQRHQRVRGQLQVLFVRTPETRRRGRLHLESGRSLGAPARPRPGQGSHHRDPHRQRSARRLALLVLHGAAGGAQADQSHAFTSRPSPRWRSSSSISTTVCQWPRF
jgi:hypothetical protein